MGGRETHSNAPVAFLQMQSILVPQSVMALEKGVAQSTRAWVFEHFEKSWAATRVAEAAARMIAKRILIGVWWFEGKGKEQIKECMKMKRWTEKN